jgi:glycosyltransferase involved in cell wall biosynthesis
MNYSPKISIIMSVYNSQQFLEPCIKSIINQSYRNFEFLIIDDNSTDNSLEIINMFMKTDDRIKCYYNNKNRGLTKNLNRLINLSQCEYIARMDADDISLQDRLEKQLCFLLLHPIVDVVGGAIAEIDELGILRDKVIYYPNTHDGCYRFFVKRDPLAHPAVLFRKTFFKKAGLYNEKFIHNQDTMLWSDGFLNSCVFANISDIVLKYRIDDSFFNNRRNGWSRALTFFKIRMIINKKLNYGLFGIIYAMIMFLITISPPALKKIIYKYFR